MIEENNIFQQKSACAPPECMSMSLQHTSAGCLPISDILSASASMPGCSICGINCGINMSHRALPLSFIPKTPSSVGEACAVMGLLQNPLSHFRKISPAAGLHPMEKKSGFMNASTSKTTADALSGSPLKGFHIFDKSGSQALPLSFIPQTPSSVGEACGVMGLRQNPLPRFQKISPVAGLHPMEKKSGFMNASTGKTTANALSGSPLKGFHIFDKSGNQTRLIYSSAYPHAPDAITVDATTKLASFRDFHDGQAFKATFFSPMQPTLPKIVNEDQIDVEENEMQEDTEEINALLYSSEEDSDSYDEDEEIKSTGHSPIPIKRSYNKLEQGDEMIGEVGSIDWRSKRQKQLKGADMDPSLSDTASSLNLEGPHQIDIGLESGYMYGQLCGEKMGFILDKKPSKKENVRSMLKILESVVPGAKGKEPLLVLDKAIEYLKTLKLEAGSLVVPSKDHY